MKISSLGRWSLDSEMLARQISHVKTDCVKDAEKAAERQQSVQCQMV